MGLYIKDINVGKIKRGAVACINVDDVIFFVGSDKIIPVHDHGDLIDRDEQIERARRLNLNTRELIAEMLNTATVVIPADRSEG